MAAAAEQSVQQSIVEAKADVRDAKEQLKGANGDEKVALQQRLAALEQRLATLEQQKLLLMQQKLLLMQQQSGATGLGTQPGCWPPRAHSRWRPTGRGRASAGICATQGVRCVSLHRAGGAVGLAEILKEQPLLVLLETLKEQQQQNYQQLLAEQHQNHQQLLTEQQQNHQQLLSEQHQLLTEQQQNHQQLLSEQHQLLTEQQQNYQGLVLDLFHPTSSIASSKELKRYRNRALEFYYGSSSEAEYTCMVTGMECSVGELEAGHIYRQQWPKSWLVSKLPANKHGLMQLCARRAQTLID
jgi:cell division septum initiation protein DivIVA